MPQTLTVAQALVGGVPGALAPHEDVVAAARAALDAAGSAESDAAIFDTYLIAHGAAIAVLVSHALDAADAARALAWAAIEAAADAAKRRKLESAGHGLAVDAYPGSPEGTGMSVAEVVYGERPSETLVVALAAEAGVGTFTLPLARTFADAFASPSLATAPGYIFEVHDLVAGRRTMLAAPADLYDLVRCAADPRRYLIRHVVTAEGEVVAAASSSRAVDAIGVAGDDAPVAIVRAGGLHPSLDAILAPYREVPAVPAAGGDLAALAPLVLPASTAAGLNEVAPRGPRVHLVALQVAGGRFVAVRDLLADASFEGARTLAASLTDWGARAGVPSAASEATEPATGRWSEL